MSSGFRVRLGAEVLQALGGRREHGDDLVAPAVEVVSEGEAVVAGELDADEHLARCHAGEELFEVRVGGVEAGAVDLHAEGLRADVTRTPGDELVEGLAGVDADVDGEAGGVALLLLFGHGAPSSGGSAGRHARRDAR